LHASGGPSMLRAARERLDRHPSPPLLIGVTVLTSLDANDLAAVGCPGEPAERVLELARLSQASGLDGIVCSPLEAGFVRRSLGSEFRLVTPGVRPATAARGDQKRVMTPAQAIAAGADYLVIGRPITAAPEPMSALAAIEDEIATAG
ncbi:MAG: orotidine-5'-phosphate decarboxylase, partial [Thiohalocapsa sp.]